jgi:acyl carrier protein
MKKKEDLKSIVCMAIVDVKPGLFTPEDIKDTDRLADDLSLDSIDFIDLIMKMEKRFKISIPDEEMEEYCNGTVSELVEYLQTKIK